MTPLAKGIYTVRSIAPEEMADVLVLRRRCFGAAAGIADRFDATATQVVVEQHTTGQIVASFRMSLLDGEQISSSYAAQFYDLAALKVFDGTMLELGRFCIDPSCTDPDILRVAWAALTAFVDSTNVQLLFGCSSFEGTQTDPYIDAFALLKARHLAPAQWAPRINSAEVFAYATELTAPPDLKSANAALPPLLRTYLMMGGWVSDHAVIDRALGTLHVFTGLEIGAIPPARKKLLRALV